MPADQHAQPHQQPHQQPRAAARRVRLRPGAAVLRRDSTSVQVGLDPPARAVLPDSPAVRRLLTALTAGTWRPPPPQATGQPEVDAAVASLDAARLLVDVEDRGGPSDRKSVV